MQFHIVIATLGITFSDMTECYFVDVDILMLFVLTLINSSLRHLNIIKVHFEFSTDNENDTYQRKFV